MVANHIFFDSKGLTTQGDAVDFEAMWAELSASLREIHTKNASKLSFEELYRNAYKLVLKKKGETLYERVKLFEQEWLGHEVRARINGVLSSTLLVGSGGVTGNTTVNERRVAGERFLKGLKQAWEDHNLCMNMTTDVLMYMVSLAASLIPGKRMGHPMTITLAHMILHCYRTASTAQIIVGHRYSQHQWGSSAIRS